ncbi:hypothetical protein C4K46_05790 [Streptococcus oricebi]|uniref:DUF443 family protein n=2 Tax=Streptococcus oricebi TaxID=1547447 RepID=A0ABS5B431_9STRE|nr:hypothetical protein [Streptococcus oricebi]
MISIGVFKDKGLFYDFDDNKVYSRQLGALKIYNLKWFVLGLSLFLGGFLGQLGSFDTSLLFMKWLYLCLSFAGIALLLSLTLKNPSELDLEEFHYHRYFEWEAFLEKTKSQFYFLLMGSASCTLALILSIQNYLRQASIMFYVLANIFFAAVYQMVVVLQIFKRHRMLQILMKNF